MSMLISQREIELDHEGIDYAELEKAAEQGNLLQAF